MQTKFDLSHFVCKTSNETQRNRVACIAERDIVETDDGASSNEDPSSKSLRGSLVWKGTSVKRMTVNLMRKTTCMVKNEIVHLKLF